MTEIRFRVPGMTCGHCVQAVRTELASVPGVTQVEVDLESKGVVVTGSSIDTEAVIAAVDEAGFEAVGIG